MRSVEWKQLIGETLHGSICHWLVMNMLSVFRAQMFTSFLILYHVLLRYTRSPIKHCKESQIDVVQKVTGIYRNFDRIDGEPMEFEWNIFTGFTTLQLSQQFRSLLLTLNETLENFTGRIFQVDVHRHLMWSRDKEKRMRVKCSIRFSMCKKIWSRRMVIFSVLMAFYQCRLSARWMWQIGWVNDVEIHRKRTPSFPIHESIVWRSGWEHTWWKIVDTLVLISVRFKLFSENYFGISAQFFAV